MAVSAPIDTLVWTRSTSAPADVTATVSSGHTNMLLFVWLAWSGTQTIADNAVTWSLGEANQVLTPAGAQFNFGTDRHIRGFYFHSPTAGASKTIRVDLSAGSDLMVSAFTCDGVDPSTPVGTQATNSASSQATLAVTVTAASGDLTTTATATTDTVVSTDQTVIDTDPGVALAVGNDFHQATGNTTHTWTETGADEGLVGIPIKQVSGGGPSLPWLPRHMNLHGPTGAHMLPGGMTPPNKSG